MGQGGLRTELQKKMEEEQREYHDFLLKLSPEDILRHTYEYTVREDILTAIGTVELSTAQISALLKSPTPLANIFRQFRDMETDYMSIVRECVKIRSGEILLFDSTQKQQPSAAKKPSVIKRLAEKPAPGRKAATKIRTQEAR